ncbi:MAG: NADH-quinone oxidoreductase subunit C [Verrucomicrobiota bacterium]|nr:NADH-quinone oxidoreductase subunit C [Verrucomicrobiota bacterium]
MTTSLEAAQQIVEKFSMYVTAQPREFRGEITLELDRHKINEVCLFARDTLKFDFLVDISGVDNLNTPLEVKGRFELVYELYSYSHRIHLRLKVRIPEEKPLVSTVSDIWKTADWHEREVYDMLGIKFDQHPDLRRILMWDGYPYYPLRKDFPLAGKTTDLPEVAFSKPAPLEGGPFVTEPGHDLVHEREPRAKTFEEVKE